jgi:hypothetical protein
MKREMHLLLGSSLFLGVICAVYWFWSTDPTGTTMLLFGFAAYLMLGIFMLAQWRRRKGIPRPEDREDATQIDGAGEVSFFPAASIWPPAIGVGAAFFALALVFGNFYWVIAGIFIVGGVVGFVVESEAREE